MQKTFFLFIALLAGLFCQAQEIKGNVKDKNTGEPIPFANVFFSGTLIGATTDLEGNFSFLIPAEGKYELVVSYVGYEAFSKPIITSEELSFLQIDLRPEVIELKDIQVNADTSGWKNNYPVFKQLFIGETENATKVEIVNPHDIFLFFDRIENGLYAHSRKEIQIENMALGYKLGYIMREFRMEYRSQLFFSFGVPRFEEMTPRGKRQARKWEQAREEAYRGSFNHFLRSMKDNTFRNEGFVVQELFRVPNRNRPPQQLIKEKLAKHGVHVGNSGQIVLGGANSDSVSYWLQMHRMPKVVDSLGQVFTDNSLVEDGVLRYRGMLRIIYTEEAEDLAFSRYRRGGGSDIKQTSIVRFSEDLILYDNGYYDVEKVFFEGYLGWASKIAEMLPLEYVPPVE